MVLPLCFEVYKPKDRLKDAEPYRSKPEIAADMVHQLIAMGFRFELVLADSLYGESGSNFISVLKSLKLPYIVDIRLNRGRSLLAPLAVAKQKCDIGKRSSMGFDAQLVMGF
jgi:SRSO17 transposase